MEPRKLENYPYKIRKHSGSTLILIKKNGEISFENASPVGKDMLVEAYSPDDGDVLLLAWTGNYRTDIFRLTDANLRGLYR